MQVCLVSSRALKSSSKDVNLSIIARDHLLVMVDGDVGKMNAIDLEWYRMWSRREKNYNRVAMEWLDDWNRRTGFHRHLKYGDFSIWWLERFPFHDWLHVFLMDLDALDRMISQMKPIAIYYVWLNRYWLGLLRIVSDKYGIPVDGTDCFEKNKSKSWKAYFVRAARCLQGSGRRLRHRVSSNLSSKPRVFVRTSSLVLQRTGNQKHSEFLDTQYGGVIEELSKSSYVVATDYMTFPRDGLDALLRKKFPHVPIEGYWWYVWKATRKAKKERDGFLDRLRQCWGILFTNCSYCGFDISESIGMWIWDNIINRSEEIIRNIELYSMIFKKENPDAVITAAEYGYGGYMIVAARMLGIPTVGLQHGIIDGYHVGYIYPKDVDANDIPMCDKMLVYGETYKTLLTEESRYNKEGVYVVGKPRLDLLSGNRFYSEVIPRHLSNISGGNRVILFTSQPISYKLAPDILMRGMKELGEGYFLVIKLHPAEEEYDRYKLSSEKFGVNNYTITRDSDLYELLYLCDVHISANSSSISEAAVFGKPTLILDCIDSSDLGKWIQWEVAFNLSQFATFKEAIEVLCVGGFGEVSRKRGKLFTKKHFYSLDGKSHERSAKIIGDIANEKYRSKYGKNILV